MKSPVIVIAGASGYIGKAVIPELLAKFPEAQITALSRSKQVSDDPRVVWKDCDLFSLKSLEESVPKRIDLALYLVHSMGATAQLDQGSFADYDLILADNFARVVKETELRQLIFLGGLIPEELTLSLHLQSRLEMEETFSQYALPVTVFRAGLILGAGGSSFQILLKLVKRLPLMICPRWTQTMTSPVDIDTAIAAIVSSALDSVHFGRIYDLAGCKPLTYMEMMRETARRMGHRRLFVTVPFFTPTLSRLWVSLITNSPKNLVYPLIESLEHPMIARQSHVFSNNWSQRSYYDLLEMASMKTKRGRALFHFQAQRNTVRSVQRLALPSGKDAEWIKEQYIQWLPRFLSPLISSSTNGDQISLFFLHPKLVLLVLQANKARSSGDRQILNIVGGLLAAAQNRGRLEFRVVLHRKFVLSAIHDFMPALPWFIYKYTQANLHLLVMNAFGEYLLKKKGS